LKAWYATSVDYEVTSMVTIADLLGRLRDRSALHSLVRLYDESPHHYARWSAVKNIGRIDKDAGIKTLKKALHDPHPELRRAAERTLVRHGLL
jgi:HEAT repeat protein